MLSPSFNENVARLQRIFDQCHQMIIFTGAGISTESGISDYRSKGGIWDRFQPITIQEFLADIEKRRQYWERKKEMFGQMRQAKPNEGHLAIARIADAGNVKGIITQNIDGLHQMAGSGNVLEIHGTNREAVCLECGDLQPFEDVYQRLLGGEEIPICLKCSGLLKPNTISFGQSLAPEVLRKAFIWSQECDLFVAVGSTLVVEPAASLPVYAKRAGAGLVIINREPTPLDEIADMTVHSTAGDFLSAVAG